MGITCVSLCGAAIPGGSTQPVSVDQQVQVIVGSQHFLAEDNPQGGRWWIIGIRPMSIAASANLSMPPTATCSCHMTYLFGYSRIMNPVLTIRAVAGTTQRKLADAAGTSQPTVAAYEAGTKSPTWRTVDRMASSVGLACYPTVATPFTRDQARSLFLHFEISQVLRSRGAAVIEIARRNISRMRSLNPHASPLLDEWERILQGTVDQIVGRMLDPSEHGRDLRQVTPFAGVLTPAQRAATYASFREAS